ncbi:integrase [Streptomyces lunaelactis]|uniref:integrase n=1 Tax=Streptomyces lunaelactis TaxID=1535768 RepID=UPI001584901F|nr:integrase [Streptomyces lunaelactis]NUL13267.1 integrase [Streptomyces lunaelactis]
MPYIEWRGNSCRVRWDTGRVNPETGKRLYDSHSRSDWTEDEALKYGLDRESDLRNGRMVAKADGKITLKDWSDLWIQSIDLDPTSIHEYRKRLRAQIIPEWGSTPLNEISTIKFNVWMKRLRAKYSANYVRDLRLLFTMLMDDAVSHQPPLINISPVPRVNRRRGRYIRPVKEEKATVLTEDLHQLAENARQVWGFTGYVFILTKAYTGMRLGEMFGLRREFAGSNWPECDEDKQRREKALKRYCGKDPIDVIRVQWQHKYLRDPERPDDVGVPILALPKYGSERSLVIPLFLAALHRELLASHDSEWVFPALSGGPLLTTDFNTYYWKPIRDGHDARVGRYARPKLAPVEAFKGKRIHLMRHAHSPHLEEDGVADVAIEERLGHILQGVRGVYADVTPTMERHIVQVLQQRWEKAQSGGVRLGEATSGVSHPSPI